MANAISNLFNLGTSRTIRLNTTGDGTGMRYIPLNPFTSDGTRDFWGNLGSIITNAISAIWGWITSWSLTDIWSWIVGTTTFLLNFNWNETDAQVQQQVKTAFLRCAGLLGAETGDILGRLACGALPTATIMVIAPEMGDSIAPGITEKLIEGATKQMLICARGCTQSLLNAGAAWLYGNVKRAIVGSDADFQKKLIAQGIPADKIAQRLEARNKPFTFNMWIQEHLIQNDPNAYTKLFKDQLYQQLGQSCTESGYVVAEHIDNYIHQKNLVTGGDVHTVEVDFDDLGDASVKLLN